MKTQNNFYNLHNRYKIKNSKTKQKLQINQINTQQSEEEKKSFKLHKKITKDNSPNALSANKHKENRLFTPIYIAKTRRLNKYNSESSIIKKELIIDTRSNISNKKVKKNKSKKFSFEYFRRKKYENYHVPFKIQITNSNKKRNSRNKFYIEDNEITSNDPTENNNMNSYKTKFLYLSHNPKPVCNSLYTILAMRKNQFLDEFNKAKELEKASLPKVKQMQFLLDTTPMANFFHNKKEYTKYIDPQNQPFSYISLLSEDYSLSEKIRFQKTMDKLTKLKKCIQENASKEYEVVKEFLLSIGLYEINNFDISKMTKLIEFIKGDFLINPSKNIKDNVKDILYGNDIQKPILSNALDCLNENFSHDNTGRYGYKTSENFYQKSKNDETDNLNSEKSKNKNKNKNIREGRNEAYFRKENKNKYIGQSAKDLIQKKKIYESKLLNNNLKRQTELILSTHEENLDIINKPKIIIDLVEKKFLEEQKLNDDMRAKTLACWDKNLKNKRLYGERENKNNYNELKKRNMLTEYICLMKAKNNYEICELKKKYFL